MARQLAGCRSFINQVLNNAFDFGAKLSSKLVELAVQCGSNRAAHQFGGGHSKAASGPVDDLNSGRINAEVELPTASGTARSDLPSVPCSPRINLR
jgi:hypothetical protein